MTILNLGESVHFSLNVRGLRNIVKGGHFFFLQNKEKLNFCCCRKHIRDTDAKFWKAQWGDSMVFVMAQLIQQGLQFGFKILRVK